MMRVATFVGSILGSPCFEKLPYIATFVDGQNSCMHPIYPNNHGFVVVYWGSSKLLSINGMSP